jgi:hypothetical protein
MIERQKKTIMKGRKKWWDTYLGPEDTMREGWGKASFPVRGPRYSVESVTDEWKWDDRSKADKTKGREKKWQKHDNTLTTLTPPLAADLERKRKKIMRQRKMKEEKKTSPLPQTAPSVSPASLYWGVWWAYRQAWRWLRCEGGIFLDLERTPVWSGTVCVYA